MTPFSRKKGKKNYQNAAPKAKVFGGDTWTRVVEGFFGRGCLYADFGVRLVQMRENILDCGNWPELKESRNQTTCKTNCTARHESQGAIVFLRSINPLRLVRLVAEEREGTDLDRLECITSQSLEWPSIYGTLKSSKAGIGPHMDKGVWVKNKSLIPVTEKSVPTKKFPWSFLWYTPFLARKAAPFLLCRSYFFLFKSLKKFEN